MNIMGFKGKTTKDLAEVQPCTKCNGWGRSYLGVCLRCGCCLICGLYHEG